MNLWFPIGYKITNEYKYKKPKYESQSWQILEYDNGNLLLVRHELFNKWSKESLLEDYMFDEFSYSEELYYFIESDKDNLLRPVEKTLNFTDDNDAISFSLALDKTREKISKNISLHDGIFLEKYSLILPAHSLAEQVDDDYVLGNWVTGGVNVSANSTRRILQLSGLKQETILKISKNDKDHELTELYQDSIENKLNYFHYQEDQN
jgi:cell division protease FtsH